jgi:predicted MPP superfamily phosphohydrolase
MEISFFLEHLASAFISFLSTLAAIYIVVYLLDNEDEYDKLNSKLDKVIAANEVFMNLQIDLTNKLTELQDQIGRAEEE